MDSLSMFLLILLACLGLGLLFREGVFKKPWLAVLCAILMAAAIALRASVFDRQTGDYMDFLAWAFCFGRACSKSLRLRCCARS